MKKIVFLTGTRADFGKMRSIILTLIKTKKFKVDVFVTGMHLMKEYGYTIEEIKKVGIKRLFKFKNQKLNYNKKVRMDLILSKTIDGFSKYVKINKPDLIMLHGDRLEALAGAVVGAYNNILVGHIEGGEVSGTIDNSIRHSISKLSHLHFVSNISHKKRLIQLGEVQKNIFVIGSPDIDIMISKKLPSIQKVKKQYKINFKEYSILIFHPVTTELDKVSSQINLLIDCLIKSNKNYIIIYPNNDLGSNAIINSIEKLKKNKKFKLFKTMRLTYFLTLLKNANFIIGNSSAGIREAPFYGVNAINVGSRQHLRFKNKIIHNIDFNKKKILETIKKSSNKRKRKSIRYFGDGKSASKFSKIISKNKFWRTEIQKYFIDKSYFDATN
jgi:UDP-N-acetylglucosamine 2-epimerase (hydrolysing)